MKTQKFFSIAVLSFAFVASLIAGGCSSKKSETSSDAAAVDTSAMKPTEVAKANLGKASSGRAR